MRNSAQMRNSVRMWENTEYLSVFSLNAGKYGPEKTPDLDTSCSVVIPDTRIVV